MMVGLPMRQSFWMPVRRIEQSLSQSLGIVGLQTKAGAKHSRLMPAMRMGRGKTIIAQLSDIDDDLAKFWTCSRFAHARATRSEWKQAA